MGGIGWTELLLIFFVVLIVFGAKRIPEIARGLGKGIREFKDATKDIARELDVDDVNRIEPARRQPAAHTEPRTYTQPTYAPPAEQPSEEAPRQQNS